VPRPPTDVQRLAHWLGYSKGAAALLRKMADSLDRGRREEAQGMANELLKDAKRANAVVVGFDFDYCRLKPARFV
jgi:hypothetical protein